MFSCRSLIVDEELTIKRQNLSSNIINTQGYFYSELNSGERTVWQIFFLNKNGIISGGEVVEVFPDSKLKAFEEKVRDGSHYNRIKDDLTNWGVFLIDEEEKEITIQKWFPSSGGGAPVYTLFGEIIDEMSFRIYKSRRERDGETFEENQVFKFEQFDFKPDSVVKFID